VSVSPATIAIVLVAAVLGAAAAAAYFYRRLLAQERTIRRQMAREASLKARFDDLFERSHDVMVVHDRRGRVSTINRAGEQLSGYSREEVRRIDATWLFTQTYIDAVQRLIAGGVDALPVVIHAELLTRKSARIPIEAHARVLAADGQLAGVTVIARNVAEREQLESQLRQAQKMEAVGRLATGIAHDFNNLITVLLGYSEELAERIAPGSPLRHPVDEMHHAAVRASGLTQQLLAFSRRQVTVEQAIDLNQAVANMRDMLQRLLGAEITLDVRLQPDVGRVDADPVQIGQIVMNLAVNGRDAMPHGGTLTIATSRVQLGDEHLDVIPGEHAMLCVTDTGIGMSPQVQRKLFEPFFTTKDAAHGTGLGLSMVAAIVRQSGGHIAVESEVGKGSTFRVYFPIASPAAAGAAAPDADAARPAARGSGVVLLAEDDAAVRRLMCDELRRRGFTVLEAADGGAALQICREYAGRIDVLVTDVVMPAMNGVDLAAAAGPLRPEMAVLFISGHPERAGVGLDPRRAESVNLLMKPFAPDDLVFRINELLTAVAKR
jgi:PAS domain S-box-containing protein